MTRREAIALIRSYARCIGAEFASSEQAREALNAEMRDALRVLGVTDEEMSDQDLTRSW